MDCRKLIAWTLGFACMVCHAQTMVDLHPQHHPLPGGTRAGHFHFDDSRHGSHWARNFGQGVAHAVAQQHKMTGGALVRYDSPDPRCKYDRDLSCP